MNDFKSYVKTMVQYIGASLIPALLKLAINPLVALNMEPSDYAISGFYNSFSTLLSPIILFYLINFYNKKYFEVDECERIELKALLFRALIVFSGLVSIICFVLLLLYLKSFSSNTLPVFPYLVMAIIPLPLAGIYQLELADYKMERKSKTFLKISLAYSIIGVITTLIFVVFAKLGAFGQMFGTCLTAFSMFTYVFIKNRHIFKIRVDYRHFKDVFLFCWPLALGAALGYFSEGYDKLLLEKLAMIDEFGYYCVGCNIVGYLSVFNISIGNTFQPDTYESIIKDDRKKLFRVVVIRLSLTIIVVLLFILFCPFIINLLTAGKYMNSILYARLYSITCITSAIYYLINDYTIAKGYPRFYLYTTVVGSLIILFLTPRIVNSYQFYGAIAMVVSSYIILGFINVIMLFSQKLIRG